MTDSNTPKSDGDCGENALQGRLLGELKLELIQPNPVAHQHQKTIKERLQDLGFWVNLLTLLAVGYYAYQAKTSNDLTRKALGAVYEISVSLQEGRGTLAVDLTNAGKVTSRAVTGSATLIRHARTNRIATQTTTVTFGGPGEAVVPEGKISALIALYAPNVNAPTVGKAWKQLLGSDIVEVTTELKYDDGYGDLLEQDWCRAMYITADGSGLALVSCSDLPALLIRETAPSAFPTK